MGNCVTDCKQKEAADVNLSAQIQPPTKDNFAKREHSIAELGSRPQPSLMDQETSFRDLSKAEENFFDTNTWLESDSEDFFSVNGGLDISRNLAGGFDCENQPSTQGAKLSIQSTCKASRWRLLIKIHLPVSGSYTSTVESFAPSVPLPSNNINNTIYLHAVETSMINI
ncbi:hypothetical protein V6N13_124485 [Hibiscus sabdariffa]